MLVKIIYLLTERSFNKGDFNKNLIQIFINFRLEDRAMKQIDGTIEVATVNARAVSKIIVSVMKPKFLVMRLVNV